MLNDLAFFVRKVIQARTCRSDIAQSSGEIQVGRGSQETYKCLPSHPSGRFITLACGFKQN
jgi:hypothetical protein